MKTTETKEMTFKTWKEFQSAILSKYYNLNSMSSTKNALDIKIYEKLAVSDQSIFFKNLSYEIYHLISSGIITMDQAISVGFDDSQLLID